MSDWQFGMWLDGSYNGKKQGEIYAGTTEESGRFNPYVTIGVEDNARDIACVTLDPDEAEMFGLRIVAAARQARGDTDE